MPPIAPRQHGPHVWTGAGFSDDPRWTWQLTSAEVEALLAATRRFESTPLDEIDVQLESIQSVPELDSRLLELRQTLIAGRGFELIRGLPVDELSPGHAAAAFVAIGASLGNRRRQNAAGDLLGHVRNVGADATDPNVRIYQTDQRQTFHTDSTDVVGLLCLHDAHTGGDSLLVSVAAVYNEMLERSPDLARLLFDPIATDRRGEVPPGQPPFFTIPVLNWHDEKLTAIYQRQYIESAQRFSDAPLLTPEITSALDLFDDIANRPDMHLSMSLRPGDMQFVHNHSLLHDRTGFVDRPGSPRHLLRLWLSVPGDRELPDVFASRYGTTTVGDRGGVTVS